MRKTQFQIFAHTSSRWASQIAEGPGPDEPSVHQGSAKSAAVSRCAFIEKQAR